MSDWSWLKILLTNFTIHLYFMTILTFIAQTVQKWEKIWEKWFWWIRDKLSFSHEYSFHFKLMLWTKYLTQTNEILAQKTSNIVLHRKINFKSLRRSIWEQRLNTFSQSRLNTRYQPPIVQWLIWKIFGEYSGAPPKAKHIYHSPMKESVVI